jgi:putative ABC transport system permease protein
MAFFPAEALVPLYRAMGDVRDIMVIASALNNGLILAATTLLLLALAGLRRKRYAVLRALGAPPAYVLLAVWLGAVALLGAGCLAGLGAGFALTAALSGVVAARTGLALAVTIGWSDLAFVIGLLALASLLALVPALASYRRPVAAALRDGA